ncbi:hypothetical protein PIB30_032896 [Stylosanthes scabra]|uniref:Uncharacterized protein n=1 Tax=Stylosanthes scabra TaxID=79078 RepID=A0ABU6UBQ0_9FABA|nr:hypothetical protein [Stylosanthes scabra]
MIPLHGAASRLVAVTGVPSSAVLTDSSLRSPPLPSSAVLTGSFLFVPSLCLNNRRRLQKSGSFFVELILFTMARVLNKKESKS